MDLEIVKIVKAIADNNRIRILNLLSRERLCVCEIERILGLNQSNLSRHLTKLVEAGLIRFEKQAQFVFYSVDREQIDRHPFLDCLLSELQQNQMLKQDINQFDGLAKQGLFCKK